MENTEEEEEEEFVGGWSIMRKRTVMQMKIN